MTGRTVAVHLEQLPVPLWLQSRDHLDDLRRECALMTAAGPLQDTPVRLVELVNSIDAWRPDRDSPQDRALFAAAADGVEVLEDLVFESDESSAEAAAHLIEVMAETDRWCAEGRYLLTMPSTPEVVRLRTWSLRQFADQAAGLAPVPWPEWPR